MPGVDLCGGNKTANYSKLCANVATMKPRSRSSYKVSSLCFVNRNVICCAFCNFGHISCYEFWFTLTYKYTRVN